LKLVKQGRNVNLLIEPFVRYWHIKNSDSTIAVGPTGLAVSGLEPDNNSTEFGAKIGLQFGYGKNRYAQLDQEAE
jgi:hypothetical protein